MAESENAFEYMDDCIHLHACRRYAQMVKKETGKHISRGCNESCSAYEGKYTGYEYESPKRKQMIDYLDDYLHTFRYEAYPLGDNFDMTAIDDLTR